MTVHRLAEGVDTGEILAQAALPVRAFDDPDSLDRRADAEAGRLVAEVAAAAASGRLRGRPQDPSLRTYFTWPTPAQRRELARRLAERRRLLIVNADDFGISPAVNRAVIACHKAGAVTSATLMTVMPAWEEAAALARENPSLGVGLHFTLTLGRPLSSPAALGPLVGPDGSFVGRSRLERLALLGRIPAEAVAAELAAQFARLEEAGLRPTHVDGHQSVHVLPGVFPIVASFCRARGLPVRWPAVGPALRGRGSGPGFGGRRMVRRALLRALLAAADAMHGQGLIRNAAFASIFDILPVPRRPEPEDYARLLRAHEAGVPLELMVHPAEAASEMEGLTAIGEISEGEYHALLETDMPAIAFKLGLRLGHYGSPPA